jgi:TRAP-type C4-dicarboxylate transport system permease small subunit
MRSLLGTSLDGLIRLAAVLGIALLLAQTAWINYGVLARYVFASPDRSVTEATSLMLVALAFLGLPLALRADAIPKVTFLIDALPVRARWLLQLLNALLIVLVGLFFSYMSASATLRTFKSGVKSEVVGWPEYVVWGTVAFSLLLFTVTAVRQLVARAAARPA